MGLTKLCSRDFHFRYRYEAAVILKRSCLADLSLGNVLQVLNMIVSMKKWIIHHQSGWQPITITLVETQNDMGVETSA